MQVAALTVQLECDARPGAFVDDPPMATTSDSVSEYTMSPKVGFM